MASKVRTKRDSKGRYAGSYGGGGGNRNIGGSRLTRGGKTGAQTPRQAARAQRKVLDKSIRAKTRASQRTGKPLRLTKQESRHQTKRILQGTAVITAIHVAPLVAVAGIQKGQAIRMGVEAAAFHRLVADAARVQKGTKVLGHIVPAGRSRRGVFKVSSMR